MEICKLTPEQIMEHWPEIKECINSSLPPHIKDNPETMLHIQESLLVGNLECWIGYEPGNISKMYVVATTNIVTEDISQTRNLLVYTLTTLNPHPREIWEEALAYLSRYAKSKNCTNIIAFSNLPEVENIVNRVGGISNWRLLYFPLH